MQGRGGRRDGGATSKALELIEWAHRQVRSRPQDFALAGQYLDMTYSEDAVRDRRRRFLAGERSTDGFVSAAQIGVDDEMRPEVVLQARISSAVVDMIASPPDMTPMAVEDPMAPALAAVLLACLVTHRDAHEYCRGLTELAALPWIDDNCVGRAMIGPEDLEGLADWGLLGVLELARAAIEGGRAKRLRLGVLPETPPAGPVTREDLMKALILVDVRGEHLVHTYAEAASVHAVHGPPRREHMPEWRDMRRAREIAVVASERESMRRSGDEAPGVMFVGAHPWEGALEDYTEAFREFIDGLATAIGAVAGAATNGLRTVPPLKEHFLLDLGVALRQLLGPLHPCNLGERGLGLIRAGCPALPADLDRCRAAITEARLTLQSVSAAQHPAGTGAEPKLAHVGLTGAQLLNAINNVTPFSEGSFNTLRRVAGIPPAEANGRGAQRLFDPAGIRTLADAAVGGKHNFRNGVLVNQALLALLR